MSIESLCSICALAQHQPVLRINFQSEVFATTARHLGGWTELNATEQLAILSLISETFQDGPFELRSKIVNGHFMVRLGAQIQVDRPTARLFSGGSDPLLPQLTHV